MKLKYILIAIFILSTINIALCDVKAYSFYEYVSGSTYTSVIWSNSTYNAYGSGSNTWDMKSLSGGCETYYYERGLRRNTGTCHDYERGYWQDDPLITETYTTTSSIGGEIFRKGYNDKISMCVLWYGGNIQITNAGYSGFFYPTTEIEYIATGNLCGIEDITLNMWLSGAWREMGYDTYNIGGDTYSFDVLDNQFYKLVFSDGHEYEFTVTENINYDRNICSFSTFNIYDNCDNLITGSYGYYNSDDGTYMSYLFEGSSFDVTNVGQTYIDIIVHSFEGTLEYHIDNPLPNTEITYSLLNPGIQWINTIWVYDAIESHLLNDALVTLSQDCIIDASLYPVRNRYTDAGGYACFSQCELDSFSLDVSLTGYQTYSSGINIGVGDMDAFNQSQLIMIELYPYDDESNTSHYNFTDFTTAIYFKDNDSKITSEIHDTDEYVDLYYHNNNTLDSSMVLKFEMGLAGTFNSYDTVLSWLIPSEEAGYKRILNDNFSNHLNYYRATLTNAEIDGWDKLKYLSVVNETNEVIYHYENLSSNVWFAGAVNNKIEYKEDISVTAYANSNNSTLLNVSLELYNETNMIEYINLTWADFSHPSDRWFYRWMPTAEYKKNKNYTVKMFGFNYQFLKDDMVYTTDLHKNKLTIRVVDESGDYLTDAYVVLDGYGSLSTGSTFYNSYQGLDDGEYLYKATKLDYTGAGWESVNLSGAYEIVNYTLTSSGSAEGAGITPIHFSDSDLQSFFYPLMFFLLMCILLGGLKYVAK